MLLIDIDNLLYTTFHGLNHMTNNLDNSLHKSKPDFKDSFVDDFLHELNDFFNKESNIYRLKQLPEDTIFRITEDNDSYFIVSADQKYLPKQNIGCLPDNIFYIPKDICHLSANTSLYKIEDTINEETYYQNCLQLRDGVYKIVDSSGNVLQ